MSAIYKSLAGERVAQGRYRELFKCWPIVHEQVRVPTREGESVIAACAPRNAPPLLLFRGSGANAAM